MTAPLRLTVLAAVVLLAFPGASARAASSGHLSVRTAATKARLRLRATSTGAHTTVRVRGRVRVHARHTRLVLVRCLNARCSRRSKRHRAKMSLHRGRYRLKASLRTIKTKVVRVELRRGRRVLGSRRLRITSTVTAPGMGPGPVPGPVGQGNTPAGPAPPSSFSLTAEPGLKPAYSPDVPDYTVSCEPGETVRVTVAVPARQSVNIDGHRAGPGTISESVPLQAGQSFGFTVADPSGSHQHRVRCTPQDFPTWTVDRQGTPQVDWVVFAPSLGTGGVPYSVIADNHGVPVWWMRAPADTPIDAKVLPDGTVAWARDTLMGAFSESSYAHYALDGTDLGSLAPTGGSVDHHDIQLLPNGDYLLLSYLPRENVDLTSVGGPASATVLDAEIREITPAGTVVWSWNSKDHIGLHETDSWGLANTTTTYHGQTVYDIVHANSVEQTGNTVLFSGRHLDAVYGIDRTDGSVDWKIGGTHVDNESLAITGDAALGSTSFDGQHDARLLSDGTLTIHDNGTQHGRPPRAVRYSLDLTGRTAALLEQVTDSRVTASSCCGSARRLSGGHWVMSWGSGRVITELTAAGAPVLTLTLDNGFSYRAQPVSSQLVSRGALHAGMDAQFPR